MRAVLVVVFAVAVGCQTVSPEPMPVPPAVARTAPAKPDPSPVVQAAFAELEKGESLPEPKPVDAVPKAGDNPPAAPGALPPVLGSAPSVGAVLGLGEVLASVEQHYPMLRAVEQERAAAGGRLLTAMGAFDLNLSAGADGTGPATYDSFRSNLGVSQGLPVGGLGVFAGYRTGYGEFPTYNLGQKTADGGEFRAGISIPLLKDRAIDRPRANVQQARLDIRLAEPIIERQRLDFQRAAARTYWAWVAAGQRRRVAERLVKLAADRDDQLKQRVQERATANIERVDNQQNIALRNGVLVQAERAFQQASIDLSLFLRDATGRPTLAGADRLPEFPEVGPADPAGFDAALATAFDLRPEPRRLRLQRDKAAVELRLIANQAMPTANAVLGGAQDLGYGKSSLSGPNGLDRSSLNAGLQFQVPVERRDARGRAAQTQAQLVQLEQQLRFAEDVIRAEVQDTFSAVRAAAEFYRQAHQRVDLARLVARAEREQLRFGRSDVLRVTLREQAAFEAEVIEVGAQQDYFRALADFNAAIGVGGGPAGGPLRPAETGPPAEPKPAEPKPVVK